MYIKAYSSKKNTKHNQQAVQTEPITSALHSKKQTMFQIPYFEDKIFSDDTWFHRPGIMPHVENHRPVIKRRILRMKDQTRNSSSNFKNRSARDSRIDVMKNTYTPIVSNQGTMTRIGYKKQQNSALGNNKFIAVKQTIVRQMSDIPDYARNIMKPCKIQAITISHRPLTGRRTSTSYKQISHRNSQRSTGNRKQKETTVVLQNGITINTNPSYIQKMYQNSSKIQPWEDGADEDFLIY